MNAPDTVTHSPATVRAEPGAAATPAAPFARFVDGPLQRGPLRQAITNACRRPEPELLPGLLEQARLSPALHQATQQLAQRLAQQLRERKPAVGRAGLVQGLLQEYALSSQEGVALMCLAEALLRIPDLETRNALIRDKISHGQWTAHVGRSPSLFVNAATWGLLLTGKLVGTHSEAGLSATLGGLIRKGGEPLIRKGVDMAMRMMGEQFVTGETIALALDHARRLEAQGFSYSYDMLGEAALTAEDAERYLSAYQASIHAIGQAAALAALDDRDFAERCAKENRAGLAQLEAGCRALGLEYVPSVANFLLIRVGEGRRVFDALQRKGVIVRPVGSYGLPDWVRVTVGSAEQNARVLSELAKRG